MVIDTSDHLSPAESTAPTPEPSPVRSDPKPESENDPDPKPESEYDPRPDSDADRKQESEYDPASEADYHSDPEPETRCEQEPRQATSEKTEECEKSEKDSPYSPARATDESGKGFTCYLTPMYSNIIYYLGFFFSLFFNFTIYRKMKVVRIFTVLKLVKA